MSALKFVAISDTHGQHEKLVLPPGDVLLHAGDVSVKGTEAQVIDFLHWFAAQDYRYKIFIAGNHDFFFERASSEAVARLIPAGVTYLNDSGVTIEGIHIWGSPVSPWFFDWAFNRHRGADIQQHWNLIPPQTDILITHGPVMGVLDKTIRGQQVGCEDLLNTMEKVNPRVHLCGHIHEAYGMHKEKSTLYINASVLNIKYELVNAPIVFSLEAKPA
jgi:Icc-related predicted phosphoesterase